MTKARRSDSSPAASHARAGSKGARNTPKPGPPVKEVRSAYLDAVALYESAVSAFQRKDFSTAAAQLRRLLSDFPSETELIDRARLHLAACERRLTPPSADPRTTPERLYAATMAINDGAPARALSVLEGVADGDPQADAAYYLRAVAETERGALDRALVALQRALDRNPGHRGRARVDPDLAPLRQLDGFAAALETAGRGASDPSRPPRVRP